MDPIIVPRAEHSLSRRQIDPDALKVLNRLHRAGYQAHLVGGSVRDLLLERPPKDFDIGTSAHPYEIKKLFRNCWIIGRRFRLAHVRFGTKTIEVATFRRKVTAEDTAAAAAAPHSGEPPQPETPEGARARLVHRDNTFGTAEEDAFRRDFTLNALFYDIGTFAILDYTGGLADLRAGLIRCIGDPDERFVEDPVRMLRAVALESRLGFRIDAPTLVGIERQRHDLAKSAPARLMEEFYKILRTGASLATFDRLRDTGLLERTIPVLHRHAPAEFWQSLGRLDAYRRQTETARALVSLTNPVLLGALLVPLGFDSRRRGDEDMPTTLGVLPPARKDVERLRHLLLLVPRLAADADAPPRTRRRLVHRSAFEDAVTWLEIFGVRPDLAESWRRFAVEADEPADGEPDRRGEPGADEEAGDQPRARRRRRRRRRRPRLKPGPTGSEP